VSFTKGCHLGNLIWRDDLLYFIDFDDFLTGPPVQDFWLLFPWDQSDESFQKRDAFLAGYDQMCSFDWSTLKLIEPLRAMRFVYYSTWIAKRYQDPIFQKFFPHFGSSQYWEEDIRNLEDILQNCL
jgi:Ser/Thr protein kinase RdoA (MazF antagonist)